MPVKREIEFEDIKTITAELEKTKLYFFVFYVAFIIVFGIGFIVSYAIDPLLSLANATILIGIIVMMFVIKMYFLKIVLYIKYYIEE
jgi:hypothetical protein